MENTIKQRVIKFYKYLGLGQRKFEETVGWSSGYISHMKDDQMKPAQLSLLKNAYPQLNTNWILTGYGNMLLPKRTYSSEEEQTVMESEAYRKLAKEIEALKGKIGDNIVIGDSAQGNYVKNDMATKSECLLCKEKEKLIESLKEQIRAKDDLIKVLMAGK